jgi:hypothetical protein
MEVTIDTSNNYITEYVNSRDTIAKAMSVEKPEPFRLVMIKCKDFCQFCPHPSGDVYSHYINFEYKYGFLSCTLCCNKAEVAIGEWFKTKAYGTANHLQDRKIKVSRSSGIVEPDWVLDKSNPFVELVEGHSCVHVIKSDKTLAKWFKVDVLVDLNK